VKALPPAVAFTAVVLPKSFCEALQLFWKSRDFDRDRDCWAVQAELLDQRC